MAPQADCLREIRLALERDRIAAFERIAKQRELIRPCGDESLCIHVELRKRALINKAESATISKPQTANPVSHQACSEMPSPKEPQSQELHIEQLCSLGFV
jgi:hypothetical protein